MTSRRAFQLRQVAMETGVATMGVAAVTVVAVALHLDFAIAGCLYLLLIVIGSTVAHFVSCAMAATIALACLDYFFVPPLYTLRIGRTIDGVALATFLLTALVITRLASRAQIAAHNAEARRKDLARLYELASRLVGLSPVVAVRREYLPLFCEIFELQAVCLVDGAGTAISYESKPQRDLMELTKRAYASDRDYDDEDSLITIRSLRTAGKPIGAIGFQGLREADSLGGPLSVLAAAMIQRAHIFQAASEAAAATQVEVLRSAILDAFAHQFKTPLAAILTAAGTVRATGPLEPDQEKMVETIEVETAGLGRLTTRLLRMARLDRDEIRPKMRLTNLGTAVARLAEQYHSQADGRLISVRFPDDPVEVPSDPEMLSLAIAQLLDNACRYSSPGSAIEVAVSSEDDFAAIRVTNQGSRILPEEQSRIFDRYYRGSAGHHSSGTGLGLYVARKIVVAHGGTLELDKNHAYAHETTFCLKLPLAKDECTHELTAS